MATLLNEKMVKVNKTHICQGCGKKIEKGETAHRQVVVGDGIDTFYECHDCHKYVTENCQSCSDFEYCVGEDYSVGTLKECQKEKLYVGKAVQS